MRENIVIIGAFNAIGSKLTLNLLQDGYRVFAVIGPNENPNFLSHRNLEVFQVDFKNADDIAQFISILANVRKLELHAAICTIDKCLQSKMENTGFTDVKHMIDLNFKNLHNIAYPLSTDNKRLERSSNSGFVGSWAVMEQTLGKNIIAYSLSKSLIFTLSQQMNPDTNEAKIQVSITVPSALNTSSISHLNHNRIVPKDGVYELISMMLCGQGKGSSKSKQPHKIYNSVEV